MGATISWKSKKHMFESLLKQLEELEKDYDSFLQVLELIFEKIKHNQDLDDLMSEQTKMTLERKKKETELEIMLESVRVHLGITSKEIKAFYPYMELEEKERFVDVTKNIKQKILETKKNAKKNLFLFDQKKLVPNLITQLNQKEMQTANENGQGILRKKV